MLVLDNSMYVLHSTTAKDVDVGVAYMILGIKLQRAAVLPLVQRRNCCLH